MPNFKSGWVLVALSFALHLLTLYCYVRQPDRLAAFTVLPIWIWGSIGLILSITAFFFLKAPLSLMMTGIWTITLLVGSDEARVLANLGNEPPRPGPAEPCDGRPVIRVASLNCALFRFGNPSQDVATWNPDIILLQDVFPHQAQQLANSQYGGHGFYRTHLTNAIISRWPIQREVLNIARREQQVTIAHPNGTPIELVNVHLRSAATNLRFWRRSTWREHRINRVLRRNELAQAQYTLAQTTLHPDAPAIFGGDFNSSASDIVHRQLGNSFVDAFASAGTGWGNTYHRRFPILRIDVIYATRQLTPVRARVVETRHSDHRMVIADFIHQ